VATPPRTFRLYHLVALAPVIGILGAPWFANRVEPYVLGMPFLLAWIVGWVVMASAVMAMILLVDRRAEELKERNAARRTR
jgi:hypothetical protein